MKNEETKKMILDGFDTIGFLKDSLRNENERKIKRFKRIRKNIFALFCIAFSPLFISLPFVSDATFFLIIIGYAMLMGGCLMLRKKHSMEEAT